MRERRFLCSLAPSEESPDTFNEKLAMRDTQWKPHTIHQIFSKRKLEMMGAKILESSCTWKKHPPIGLSGEWCCSHNPHSWVLLLNWDNEARVPPLLATTSSLFLQPALSNHLVQETSCKHSQREQGPLWTMSGDYVSEIGTLVRLSGVSHGG